MPASLLALTDVNSVEAELSEEEKMALSIVNHNFSSIANVCMHVISYS